MAVLLPADPSRAASSRDAARLAVTDLGADAVTAALVSGHGEGLSGAQLGAAAKAAGAVAAVGASTPARTSFALAGGGVYDFRLSEADSAEAGVVAAANSRPATVALLVADTPRAGEIEKLVGDRVTVFGGRVVAAARFGDDPASIEQAIQRIATAGEQPGIVLVTAGRASPPSVVAALRARGGAWRTTRVVGTDAWSDAARRDKAVEGAWIATLDAGEMAPMAQRFRAAYGRAPDADAAYVYDLVALSVGIARAVGPQGFQRSIIEGDKGFRGSTGVFRFRLDGGNERLLAVYSMRASGPKLERKALPSF